MATNTEPSGFGRFFQQYTKTWMHAVATAGLTAFGLLSFVHRGFVLLALACYIVPPIVLYITRRGDDASGNSMSPTDAALAEQDEPSQERRDDPEARSAPESGTDSLGPPPAERDARSDSSSGDGRESLEDSPTDDREPEAETEPETQSEPAPSSEPTPDAELSTESAGAAAPEPDPNESAGEVEPAAADATLSSEPHDEDETDSEPEPEWRHADAPTDATLLDAAVAGSSAVAVGEGGVVTMTDGEEWSITLEDGPAAQGQALHGVDATEDGEVAWVAGDGGAVGRLELDSGRHTDFSAPGDRTDNLAGIAVAGAAGDETVLLINGSGEVLGGRYRDGDCSWDEPLQPGSGSSLSDVVLDGEVGYCCDTNDGVFATDDGGERFEAIGIDDADGTPTGLAAGEDDSCHLCTDAGVVHRYDGSRWTPERVCEDALSGIARAGDRLAVCTADGAIYERDDPTDDWERADADAEVGLEAIALGDELGVAVGGEGTTIERR
ncbi:hypothetical protein QA600_06350 [Natronococcus sp. A-GB1]|uniref:hypothetical protein n=1 Tax=Natronococcus sp. A-GB1 TaxID=3037648 RepID=UPI00241C6D21|nr:hypothetical protein [Natronococcus sp. A-GB1]MDG5758959.1 hypothetical protein [Natronococcus sp. A-GB1]